MKIIQRKNNAGRQDQMLVQVTETTFQRTRTVHRGTSGANVSDSSDSDVPQVEWRKMDSYNKKNPETGQSMSTPTRREPLKLVPFWDLVGSQRNDNSTPGTRRFQNTSAQTSLFLLNTSETEHEQLHKIILSSRTSS